MDLKTDCAGLQGRVYSVQKILWKATKARCVTLKRKKDEKGPDNEVEVMRLRNLTAPKVESGIADWPVHNYERVDPWTSMRLK